MNPFSDAIPLQFAVNPLARPSLSLARVEADMAKKTSSSKGKKRDSKGKSKDKKSEASRKARPAGKKPGQARGKGSKSVKGSLIAAASRAAGAALSLAGEAVMGGAKKAGKSIKSIKSMGSNSKGEKNDAIDVLKDQHREVESLFKQFERARNDNECFEVAQVICQKLTVHATIEEELLYPLARSRGEDGELKDLVLESLEEHRSAKRLIADIQAAEAGDETLEAKVKVLKEQISHHVDEEEDQLFPQLKKELAKAERRSLGQQLLERAEELEAAADGGAEAELEAGGEGAEDDTEEDSDDKREMPNGAMPVAAERDDARHPRSTSHH